MSEASAPAAPVSPPHPRQRGALFRVGKWLLIALLVLVVQYPVRVWFADRELQTAIEEVDRRDPGWRMEELEVKRAAVPDGENAAHVVLRAAGRLPANWGNKPLYTELAEIPPPACLHERQASSLRAELKGFEPALREARKLQ